MGLSDLWEAVRLIIQSEPPYLSGVAVSWQKIATAVQNQEGPVTRALDDVVTSWESQRPAMTAYRTQVSGGLTKLAGGINVVVTELRQIVPQLAALRAQLVNTLSTMGVSVVGVGLALIFPPAIAAAGVIGGSADVLSVIQLVNAYNERMASLRFALTAAESKFDELEALTKDGGIIPAPPTLSTNPN
jgi:hypothetical protein